jgi:hypothetical protein
MGKSVKILRSALLSENVKAGLSNSRVDTEGEMDVLLENILRLLTECNDQIGSQSVFFDAKSF